MPAMSVGGSALGAVFDEILKGALQVKDDATVKFTSNLYIVTTTLQSIKPAIDDIEKSNRRLACSNEETIVFTDLTNLLHKGEELVKHQILVNEMLGSTDENEPLQERPDNWRDNAVHGQHVFSKLASAISKFEPITICASAAQFVVNKSKSTSGILEQKVTGIDWNFNSWGGKAIEYAFLMSIID
ncbi:hypothetical protein F0562_013828 [Nyssa sinensis]|uniref:RPW8 domain-containing protein n=1 Tax=Nyssa sinensis TaxID=561372 RepID=A0A5J4ZPE2_9ASTE|nr:hypothetical protein F0562_013828 [Nyssa sinensis]